MPRIHEDWQSRNLEIHVISVFQVIREIWATWEIYVIRETCAIQEIKEIKASWEFYVIREICAIREIKAILET